MSIDIEKITVKEAPLSVSRSTVESGDYRERLKAEYFQTKSRMEKLHRMLIRYRADKIKYDIASPVFVLENQEQCMRQYLEVLEIRAEYENIDLYGEETYL